MLRFTNMGFMDITMEMFGLIWSFILFGILDLLSLEEIITLDNYVSLIKWSLS